MNAVPVERDFFVRALSKDVGLPDTRVLSLLADRKGFLWIGTRKGVTRYDGSQWVTWSRATDPQIHSEECLALAEHPDGSIWVGTMDGLVVLGDQVTHRAVSSFEPAPVSEQVDISEMVRTLAIRGDGAVLMGTQRGGLLRDPAGNWKRIKGEGMPTGIDLVTSTHWSPSGEAWVGTSSQLYRAGPGLDGWESQFKEDPQARWIEVDALATDGDGRLQVIRGRWERALGSLWRREAGGWVQQEVDPINNRNGPLFLARDKQGALWHAFRGSYLVRWFRGVRTLYALPEELRGVRVRCLAQSLEGDYWLGTEQDGLLRLSPRTIGSLTGQHGLPSDSAWSLLQDRGGQLWVGTAAGVAIANLRSGEVQAPLDLALPDVRALAEDVGGRVWIGTGLGLYVREGGRMREVVLPGTLYSKVRALSAGRDGAMWVATARGICRMGAGQTNVWRTVDGLPAEDVRVIVQGRSNVWAGTFGGGLVKLDPADPGRVIRVPAIPAIQVWALHEDQEGVLWVGTDGGLYCLRGDTAMAFSLAHGLPVNLVNHIEEDGEGWLWVGHDQGVYRGLRQELLEVARGLRPQARCVPYDEDDGMRKAEINGQRSWPAGLRLQDGRIAFAGEGGVSLFDPRSPPDLSDGPAVFIERVQAAGRMLYSSRAGMRSDGLVVPPALRDNLSFEFSAISFRSPGRVRYRHRMLGLDASWREDGGSRQVAYASVPPGRYTIEVAAANRHGYWSKVPARLVIEVEPHWHERTLFRLLGLLLAAAAVLGAVALWLQVVQRRHVRERREALARERARLAQDLHDSLGASLTEITLLSCTSQHETVSADTLASRLRSLSERTQESVQLLRDIIWTTSPRSDTLDNVAGRVAHSAERLLGAAGVACRLDIPEDLPEVVVGPERRRQVLLVVNEVLNNIVRHARATEVRVSVRCESAALVLRMEDNGCGFDPAEVAQRAAGAGTGLGLGGLRQRAVALGGACEIESRPGAGTRVTLRVPAHSRV